MTTLKPGKPVPGTRYPHNPDLRFLLLAGLLSTFISVHFLIGLGVTLHAVIGWLN